MISELQAGVRASMPQAAASPAAVPAAHGGDVARTPSANTTPIPKAEIKVDTERMKQWNKFLDQVEKPRDRTF